MSTRLKDNKSLSIRTAQEQRLHKVTYLLSLKTMENNDPQAASPETKKIILNILRWQKYLDAKTMNTHTHTHTHTHTQHIHSCTCKGSNTQTQIHRHTYTHTTTHTNTMYM